MIESAAQTAHPYTAMKPSLCTTDSAPIHEQDNGLPMKFRFTSGWRHDRTPVARDDPFGTGRAGRTALHYAVIDDPVGPNHTAGLKTPPSPPRTSESATHFASKTPSDS